VRLKSSPPPSVYHAWETQTQRRRCVSDVWVHLHWAATWSSHRHIFPPHGAARSLVWRVTRHCAHAHCNKTMIAHARGVYIWVRGEQVSRALQDFFQAGLCGLPDLELVFYLGNFNLGFCSKALRWLNLFQIHTKLLRMANTVSSRKLCS